MYKREILSDNPRFFVERVLFDLEILSPPVNLDEVCQYFGLAISRIPETLGDADSHSSCLKYFGTEKGKIQAFLHREDEEGKIFVCSNLGRARERFSIAHEIGHFDLPWHKHMNCLCSSLEFARKLKPVEREANSYAGELLMPFKFIAETINDSEPSYDAIIGIRDECGASFEASAIRYVHLSPRRCALVLIGKRTDLPNESEFPYHVKYCVQSKRFPGHIPTYQKLKHIDFIDTYFDFGDQLTWNVPSQYFDLSKTCSIDVMLKRHGPSEALLLLSIPEERRKLFPGGKVHEGSLIRSSLLRKTG